MRRPMPLGFGSLVSAYETRIDRHRTVRFWAPNRTPARRTPTTSLPETRGPPEFPGRTARVALDHSLLEARHDPRRNLIPDCPRYPQRDVRAATMDESSAKGRGSTRSERSPSSTASTARSNLRRHSDNLRLKTDPHSVVQRKLRSLPDSRMTCAQVMQRARDPRFLMKNPDPTPCEMACSRKFTYGSTDRR